MESRYLLDTNTASYIIKGNRPAVDRRMVKVPMAQLAISAITEGELRYGAERLPHATRLHSLIEDFFLRVMVLPWNSDAAQQYGLLRATLEREGQPIGNLDIMVGASRPRIGNGPRHERSCNHPDKNTKTRRLDDRSFRATISTEQMAPKQVSTSAPELAAGEAKIEHAAEWGGYAMPEV